MRTCNFDANASYGLLPEVAERLLSVVAGLANGALLNPSSIHQGGQRAKMILDDARDSIRKLVGAKPSHKIVFTSGATEANNWVLSAPFLASSHYLNKPQSAQLVTSCVEHHSVLETVERLAKLGVTAAFVSPGADGWHETAVSSAVSEETKLFSCMLANNETGELLPVGAFTRAARARSSCIFTHTDAVQAAGKIPIAFDNLAVDAMTLSAHKLGALAGCGALILRDHSELAPLIVGGPQESRFRAGTENVLGIAAFGIAADIAHRTLSGRMHAMTRNKEAARRIILSEIPYAAILRDGMNSLPNTLSVHIPRLRADDLVVAADLCNICISSGAACMSGKQLPSHVLMALGYSETVARETVRLSFRAEDSEAVVAEGVNLIATLVKQRHVHQKAA